MDSKAEPFTKVNHGWLVESVEVKHLPRGSRLKSKAILLPCTSLSWTPGKTSIQLNDLDLETHCASSLQELIVVESLCLITIVSTLFPTVLSLGGMVSLFVKLDYLI